MIQIHGVTVRSIRTLRGPNRHSHKPVLQIVLDIGPYEERPSNSFPGFTERITGLLPELHQHECNLGRPGGFVERLQRGTYLGHITEHITLALQNRMGFDVAFGRARSTGEPGVYSVVFAYKEEEPARAAFEVALRLTLAALENGPFDFELELEKLLEVANTYRLGPSTAAIVEAARARKIPVLRLMEAGSLVQLGYGVHQKRIWASQTSNTSQIAVELCEKKPLTNRILRAVGVPVPDGHIVRSIDEAWAVAQGLGLPVVVKPESGQQGKGVSVNLRTEAEVRSAFAIADRFGQSILVERYIEGQDYRLLVVSGKMEAAARREPAQVRGDGERTIQELVERINRDPRRGLGHGSALTRITLDEAAELVLLKQGLTSQSVPAAEQCVLLRNNCNLSTGGTSTDVTDEVHPSNVRLAELAAQILALDVAGLDMVCKDISRPLSEQGGAIVEVNAAPGLRMHLHPNSGRPRDVGVPIVEMLYPGDAPAYIPIIAVTGTNGKTTVTRLISHMYETAHFRVGMTCTDGTYIARERIMTGDCAGPRSAQAVLLHPRVEVAVLETARGGILREGLAFDHCSIGVVTNVSADHLGRDGISTVEEMARLKQVVIESIHKEGAAVLNAEDPLVAEMAAATDARVIYFGQHAENHVLAAHLRSGGTGICVNNGMIVVVSSGARIALVELSRVAFTLGGGIRFQVQNALAATAAAWAAGINPAMIVRALTTFQTSTTMTPGRFNILDIAGVQVILDYGHNPTALQALAEAVAALGRRRTLVVLGLPGDRRDEDLVQSLAATVPLADEFVLHDQLDRCGRAPLELPKLLQSHLPSRLPHELAPTQHDAILLSWQRLRPGDRMVIIVDQFEDAMVSLQVVAERTLRSEDGSCTEPVGSRSSYSATASHGT